MIPNISPHSGLTPKSKFFDEVGDICLNVDACIELCKQADTPQAKAVYRAYRKRLATSAPGLLTPEKHREQAFFDGLHDLGISTPMKPIKGTM